MKRYVYLVALTTVLGACSPRGEPQSSRVLDTYLHGAPLGKRKVEVMREDSTLQHSPFRGISGRVADELDGFTVYILEFKTPPGEVAPGRWERVRAVRLISSAATSASQAEQRIRPLSAIPPIEGCAGLTAAFHVLAWTFQDGSGAVIVRPADVSEGQSLTTQLIVYDRNVDFASYVPNYRFGPCEL